jgi:hypothetical protein
LGDLLVTAGPAAAVDVPANLAAQLANVCCINWDNDQPSADHNR